MSVSLYLDVHVRKAIAQGLRMRGVDVLTAQEDAAERLTDAELLDRAAALGRVLFTHDADLLGEATRRQQTGEWFSGVIYAHQLKLTIGQCLRELELIAKTSEPADFENWVEFLPLK